MIYALDSNAVSYLIQGNDTIAARLKRAIMQGDIIVIPPTVYYEVRRGFKHKSAPKKEAAFSLICKSFEVGDMNLAAWEEASDIYAYTRKAGVPIEDTDILIAAFCVVNGYVLVTNNVRHFKDINGLIVEDWSASNVT